MNDGIGSALAMQLFDPYLCASDIKCILAFRITGDHGMQELFGFLPTNDLVIVTSPADYLWDVSRPSRCLDGPSCS